MNCVLISLFRRLDKAQHPFLFLTSAFNNNDEDFFYTLLVARMIKFRQGTINFSLYILLSIGASYSIWSSYPVAYGVDFYSEDEMPYAYLTVMG